MNKYGLRLIFMALIIFALLEYSLIYKLILAMSYLLSLNINALFFKSLVFNIALSVVALIFFLSGLVIINKNPDL